MDFYLNKDMEYYNTEKDKEYQYMTADEAFKLTKTSAERVNNEQMTDVMKAIKNAAMSGETYINYYNALSDWTCNKLQELGYHYKSHYDQRDGYDYRIWWCEE